MRKVLLTAQAAMLSCASMLAQAPGTGPYPFASFDNRGFDSINLGNNNIRFTIPIVSTPGRGLGFNYAIQYEGLIWNPVNDGVNTTWTPAPTWGFTGILNGTAFSGFMTHDTQINTDACPVDRYGRSSSTQTFYNYAYQDPYGAVHGFNYTYTTPCVGSGSGATVTGQGPATDGSGYSFNGHLTNRNGVLISPGYSSTGQDPSNETDTNGNQISFDGTSSFTDTRGVTALTISGSGPVTFTYPVALQSNGATTASAVLSYRPYTVRTNFQASGIGEYGSNTVNLVDRITLAYGSFYAFGYEGTPGATDGAVTGRLASVTLPTGGTINYSYRYGWPGGINTDGTPAGLTRTTSDGTKEYDRNSSQYPVTTEYVLDEKGNETDLNFIAGTDGNTYETGRSVYQGANSGPAPLEAITTVYNNQPSPTQAIGLITEADVATSFNGGSQSTTQTGYDTFGNAYSSSINGSPNPSSPYPTTTFSYNALSEPTSIVTKDSSNNVISSLSFGYDETSLTATSGIPQHGAAGGIRGNQTTASLATGNGTLTKTTAYYDPGVAVSSSVSASPASPPPTFTTTYGYDSTQTFGTATTLPTPSSGVSLSTSAQYDLGSGVLVSTTGMNAGQTTTYAQYDPLLRPTVVQFPDGGSTTVHYYGTYQTGIVRAMTSGTNADTEIQYDGYGRVSRVAVADGQASNPWYQTDYCYDASGLLQFQSAPYQGPGFSASKQCSGTGTSYAYDALGRVTSTGNPDGTVTTQYVSRAVETTDVNGVRKITQFDLFGRIASVCEVSSSGGPDACGGDIGGNGLLTAYSYNIAQHLTTVTQGVQTRTFQTDAAGRTIRTTEPERGTTSYTYSYNATGLVTTRTRPKANQTIGAVTNTVTQYDSLGRVLTVSYDDGLTATKYYSYDKPAGWAEGQTGVAGMLAYAMTYPASGPAGTIFSYDAMGRPTQMYECLPSGCGNASADRPVSASWDWVGNLTVSSDNVSGSIAYGRSPAGEITSITQQSYTDQYNTPNLVSNVVNGPNGPLTYSMGNGLSQANLYDSVGRQQGGWVCGQSPSIGCPNQVYGFYKVQKGSQISSASDDVTGQGTAFGYDEFNRLSSSNYGNGQQTFSYTYDRYGNRWGQNAPQGGPAPSYSFDPNTNENRSMGYDSAGNVISDGLGNMYQYDAEGNVLSVSGNSSASYTYDALNNRVRSQTGSLIEEYTFDYAGRRTGTWMPSTNIGTEGRIYWGSRQVAFRDQDGTTYFDHKDWIGTERMRTNWTGQIANTYVSLPFGDGYAASSPGAASDQDTLHFSGLDKDTAGTAHAQFRQYNSTSGQWMSPDPYDGSYDLGEPESLNRYIYVLNNPLGYTDPNGTCALITAGIGMSPDSQTGRDLISTAGLYGANVAFPYAGQSKLSSIVNIALVGLGTNGAATAVASQAIQATFADSIGNNSDYFALGFSGGAQANLSANTTSFGTSSFYDPGLGIGQSIPAGADVFRGGGPISDLVNATSAGGNTVSVAGCGHNVNCAITNSSTLQKALENAGPCTTPTIFSRNHPPRPINLVRPTWNIFDILYMPSGEPSVTWDQVTSWDGSTAPPVNDGK